MDKSINLSINDTKVTMNPFVKKIFIKVITGLIGSLDKLPDNINKIMITIKDEENK